MTETVPAKREAFVLMPFDEAFTDIYENLIKDSFEAAGFRVYRADDIESQQNILRDIVTAIATAEVVIADLTDSNPNVYYELGLAHALRKPVVLLTQDIGSVPFDLRSYRVIEYDTYFARFEDARARLGQVAGQIATGKVVFGNPVSDFSPPTTSLVPDPGLPTPPETQTDETESQEPGVLDCMVEVEDGFQELTSIMGRVLEHVSEIGRHAEAATPELEEAGKQQNLRRARGLMRSLGEKYQGHVDELRTLNSSFRDSLAQAGNALEVLLKYISATGQTDEPSVRELLDAIMSMESPSREGKDSIASLVQVMDALPRMERTFDKSRKRIVGELERFADNIDQLMSMAFRVRSIVAEPDGNPSTLTGV